MTHWGNQMKPSNRVMKRIKKNLHLFIVIFCLFTSFSVAAQDYKTNKKATSAPLVLKIDSASAINVQRINKKRLNRYLHDKEFQYDKANLPGISAWDRFWNWIYSSLFKNAFDSPGSGSFFYYLFLALGVIFLVFIFFRITGLNLVSILRGNAQTVTIPYTESLENIHQIDFEDEIEKALSNKNYRLAVRLLYLSTLKYLDGAGLITWQIEKTNSAYVNELKEPQKKHVFNLLTVQFEYVWYGDFPIDDNTFKNIQSVFQQFKGGLQ